MHVWLCFFFFFEDDDDDELNAPLPHRLIACMCRCAV